jgi:putative N6-adenine-specific DNA methylase
MVMASEWDQVSPLLDPFCGSGTIPIEAALMARNMAPGRARRFAFMDWPGFDVAAWQALLAAADEGARGTASAPAILASDRDAGAIRAARANAERAGVADGIDFAVRAISDLQPLPARGWSVTNPPYGVRVSASKDPRNLYARLGHVLRARCPGWQVAILCRNANLARQTGLNFETRLALKNGGLKVSLLRGRV